MGIFRRPAEFAVAWEPKPWWRSMSLLGWTALFFGLFATVFFVFGLVTGEVLFVLSPKAKSGPIQISAEDHIIWYWVLMAANLAISVVVWGLFFSWIKERQK
jgi:hypothetical protein